MLIEHPFTVNGDISDAKTDLALMRMRTERLQLYNKTADVERVRYTPKELYIDLKTLLDEIDCLHLGLTENTVLLLKK
ncbi:hypothetical protein [Clostridium sp. D33t1_170424_F3]|uniref:hypothetical protein n=1 Tax=Clostridium sp. D33t1_170424_F3 TaxID=2787099 RepID=UPI0018A9FA8C|nr:hypothetical protein [Clostridium sp. D33t1_170424_F3]